MKHSKGLSILFCDLVLYFVLQVINTHKVYIHNAIFMHLTRIMKCNTSYKILTDDPNKSVRCTIDAYYMISYIVIFITLTNL